MKFTYFGQTRIPLPAPTAGSSPVPQLEHTSTHTGTTLDQVLTGGGLRTVYQPIVELDSGAVIGFEALVRGPEGSALERPDALFAASRQAGRLGDLDWWCRATAFRTALQAGALIACDLGDDGPDAQRRFDFLLTYDRQFVVAAARRLMTHVDPEEY